jgi:hypothetical protein
MDTTVATYNATVGRRTMTARRLEACTATGCCPPAAAPLSRQRVHVALSTAFPSDLIDIQPANAHAKTPSPGTQMSRMQVADGRLGQQIANAPRSLLWAHAVRSLRPRQDRSSYQAPQKERGEVIAPGSKEKNEAKVSRIFMWRQEVPQEQPGHF